MSIELLVTVLSGIIGMWIYYLVFNWISGGLEYTPWAMTAVCWFMIPYFVFRSFKYFRNIHQLIYDLWRINHSGFNRNYWDNLDTFKALTVKVKLKRKVGDFDYTSLSVRLAEGIALGDWFDWLVEDQNRRFPQAQIEINMEGAESGLDFLYEPMVPLSSIYSDAGPTLHSHRKQNKEKSSYLYKTSKKT